MEGDKCYCFKCNKCFSDKSTPKYDNKLKVQDWRKHDTRYGKAVEMCPFCYGYNTINVLRLVRIKKTGKPEAYRIVASRERKFRSYLKMIGEQLKIMGLLYHYRVKTDYGKSRLEAVITKDDLKKLQLYDKL